MNMNQLRYEEYLENMIYEVYMRPDGRYLLQDRGLNLRGSMIRQFKLQTGKVPDLITFEVDWHLMQIEVQVIELKRGQINMSTFEQAYNYWLYIRDIIQHHAKSSFWSVNTWTSVEFVLIGSEVSDVLGHLGRELSARNNDFSFRLSPYKYKYDAIEGLSFDAVQYYGFTKSAFERPQIPYNILSDAASIMKTAADADDSTNLLRGDILTAIDELSKTNKL